MDDFDFYLRVIMVTVLGYAFFVKLLFSLV